MNDELQRAVEDIARYLPIGAEIYVQITVTGHRVGYTVGNFGDSAYRSSPNSSEIGFNLCVTLQKCINLAAEGALKK